MKKVLVLVVALIVGISVDLLWGSAWHLLAAGEVDSLTEILYFFRFPRVANALISGIGLALSGLVLQTLFHNPLAGPYVLGISSGSALGVAVALMFIASASNLLSFFSLFASALIGAVMVIMILTVLSRRYSMVSVIIAGVLMAGIFSAMISILQFFSPAQSVKNFVIWTMASVDMSNYGIIVTNVIIILFAGMVIFIHTNVLDSFYLGEDYAMTMGVNARKYRTVLIFTIGLIIALLTSSYGPIAFVGVISPHLARWISHSQRHKSLFVLTIMLGANFMIWADFLSHAFTVVLPINAVLSLMGLPILFVLILKREYDFF